MCVENIKDILNERVIITAREKDNVDGEIVTYHLCIQVVVDGKEISLSDNHLDEAPDFTIAYEIERVTKVV